MPYALRVMVSLVVVAIGATVDAAAQMGLELDLSVLGAENPKRPLPAGISFRIVLQNRVPGSAYTYVISPILEERSIPALPSSGYKGKVPTVVEADDPSTKIVSETCDAEQELVDTFNLLNGLSDEKKVSVAVGNAQDLIKRSEAQAACAANIAALQSILRATRSAHEAISVPRGFDLTVVVTRTDATNETPAKNWTISYTGRSAGEWVTTYGFTFLTDFPWGSSNESFLAAETATQGRYVIEQNSTRERLRFVPTIFYTWHPAAGNISPGLSLGFSGGLGFDLSNPVVALGPTLVYRRNLSLHIGVAAARVDQLLGRYTVGEIITTNLTPEQLRESNYRLNPFVSLSFNFATSPFSSEDEKEDNQEEKQPEESGGEAEDGEAAP